MINRRTILESLLASFAVSTALGEEHAQVSTVFQQDLPDIEMKNWAVTAVEVRYPAGVASAVHRHPGFVLGYVLEGTVRFGLRGESERIVNTGQMFYEPPGSVHQVSSNASSDKPARLLALILAERGAALNKPA